MAVKPIPDGFNSVNTYLIVKNAVEATEFYRKAFGAEPGVRMPGPDGQSTMHAEIHIGNSSIMMSDENPQWNMKSPQTLGGIASSLHVYVVDADKYFKRAVDAGCEVVAPRLDFQICPHSHLPSATRAAILPDAGTMTAIAAPLESRRVRVSRSGASRHSTSRSRQQRTA